MRRSVIAVVAIGIIAIAGVACTRVVLSTSSGAAMEERAETGSEADIATLCDGRGAAVIEFSAAVGKGRSWVRCRAETDIVDAGIEGPVVEVDAATAIDALPPPASVSVAGGVSADATSALPSRPVPAGCVARYGGQRRRPPDCPDCSPRLVTTVELTCVASTIQLSADGERINATCTDVECEECVERIQSFVGTGTRELQCR